MSQYFLGIDGGQSSTTALIADETGRILGRGQSGPCNHVAGSEAKQKFVRVITECLEQACQAASLKAKEVEFTSACLGLSGGAADKAANVVEIFRSNHYRITHDAEIALTGATGGGPGIIIIAGTGSIAYGRDEDGQTARAGGWGYVYGDEGGGFDLVRRALRAALRYEEGWGPPTQLTAILSQATGAFSLDELVHRFYTPAYSRSRVASLAPLVTKAAEDGDRVAQEIVLSAADQLVWYVRGVYRRLFAGSTRVPVAHIGGVFRSSLLRTTFGKRVREATGCRVQPPLYSPAAGALLQALHTQDKSVRLIDVPESDK